MGLNISNATTQNWVFFYRERLGPNAEPLLRALEVRAGGQEILQCEPSQKAAIVAQLEAAGAHDAAEVHRKIGRFHGLMYRDDAEISADEILMGHESVQKMQRDRTVEQNINSALAADRALNPEKGRRRTRQTTVTVEQEMKRGARPTGNEVAFEVSVDAEEGGAKLVKHAVA